MDALQKISELRRVLTELRAHSVAFKKSFADVQKVFDAGSFASDEQLNSAREHLAQLTAKENLCRELWSDIFDAPFPKTFAETETALSAHEKRLVEQGIVNRAEKFMWLTTEQPALKKILAAHQRKLKTLLNKETRGAKAKEAVELYAKFVDAFNESDAVKKYSASLELRETFGDVFIGAGLFGDALTLPVQGTLFDVDADTQVDTPVKKTPPVEPPVDEPPVDYEKILRDKDALLTEDDLAPWEKIFVTERGDKREITAKRLRKDFEDSFLYKEKARVLIQAAFDNCFSIKTICEGTKFSETDVENAVVTLLNKGYLQKYSFGDLGGFYGLTEDFFNFLKADGAKEFFKFFSSKMKLTKNLFKDTDFLEADFRFALPRTIFIKMRAVEFDRESKFESVNVLLQSIRCAFKSKHGKDLIFCCTWNDAAECKAFIDDAKTFLSQEKTFDRVIVAGLNASHAAKIFDALDEMLKLPKAEQFTFAFDEDAFRRRGTTEKVSIEEIWPPVTDKPDPSPEPPVDKPPKKTKKTKTSTTSVDKPSKKTKAPTPEPPVDDTTVDKTPPVDEPPKPKVSIVKEDKPTTPLELNVPDELKPLYAMFAAKKFYCATAYLRALALQNKTYAPLCRQLAYALNDPAEIATYGASNIISLFNESATPDEVFLTAATLRTFFYSHKQFDYDMKTLHGIVNNFDLLENDSPLSDLIYELMNFKDAAHNGADFYADYRLKNRQQAETKIARLRRDAQTCLDRITNFNDSAYNPRFIETKKVLFNGSELTDYLKATAEDKFDEDVLDLTKTFLQTKFMREDSPLAVENVDNFKLDEIIAEAWDAAGKNIRRKKHTLLVGELRNNIVTSFKKAIEILCERVNLFEEVAPLHSDFGAAEYQKVRDKLIAKARAAQKILLRERLAGGEVLLVTLQEIIDKLEGRFEPVRHKYFYVHFLRGTEILLDENYLPILTFNTQDGTNQNVAARVVEYTRATLPTFEERIENIFEKGGCDFGTAQLIDAYLEDVGGESFIDKRKYNLQACVDSVKFQAGNARKKFFGFLELAQNYGKFDAAPENTKERILKLIDRCFELANRTDNFGVFFRVKTFWENKTQADAAKYAELIEDHLTRGIKNYCRNTNELPDAPELQKTVAQIRKMIARQNYTVAQGLINRLSDGKLCVETEQATGQTHLQRFLEDYETYYYPVRKAGESFKTLIGKSHRFRADTSKGIKGGEILIDSWLPNGFPQNGDVGEDKIERLLNALGFKVETVKRAGALKKDALYYKVKLRKPSNGRASNYNHPISAFGSKAEINGFRVVCLFGMYNADGLIERFRQIGNAENALVLLDYALELPTRRELARKIKAEPGISTIFAVVDRVVMMYLVKNYDELQMNKILMSLTMPFAACQPYVTNPNVPIPPEIFIGREKEIAKVLDFDGANLVYGGRQLGKTALLKMACASLDRNENNDRAVFVDVNKCDYNSAALKICKALREENFFDETFPDTSDWTELTDAIRKRLASDEPNKIPRFMLALDETDDFIKSCRTVDFKPVLALIELQQKFHNGSRFKFVMAGLRDVVRFYREDSLDDNNQIGKLPSLPVKPFDAEDANKLLKEPLRCVGLYFSDDENADSLAMMILETTNYFPGLIQLYCSKLIEALSKEDYASYSEADSPIYEVSESHVQNVLGEESFNEEIKNKINMTLRLGDDKYYYVIAKLMAYRYHNDDNVAGYSAEDILFTAEEFGLENSLPKVKQIEALLKELCELNILRETDKGKYLFVRQRFLNMIGTSDEIEDEIMNGFGET